MDLYRGGFYLRVETPEKLGDAEFHFFYETNIGLSILKRSSFQTIGGVIEPDTNIGLSADFSVGVSMPLGPIAPFLSFGIQTDTFFDGEQSNVGLFAKAGFSFDVF